MADEPQNSDLAASPNSDPWIGQSLSSYYLIQRIGEGGMGIVYLARHLSLDRLAAVKFLASHMVSDKTYVERFLHEAKGAAKLSHPNIVAVYDAGALPEDSLYYFIMEYVEGRDLGSLQRENGIFETRQAVGYIRQAAQALGYAHKKKIIHRDIKPDNLMLTPDGVIKVGDLGLAKWSTDDMQGGMTQTGVVMGTPYYMSPEQVRGAKDIDGRTDVYSLGGTLFHLLTGKIPFEGSSPAVIMAMHLNSPPPPANVANPDLDDDICAIIQKMMMKKPQDRFQTMEELDGTLREYEEETHERGKPKLKLKGHAGVIPTQIGQPPVDRPAGVASAPVPSAPFTPSAPAAKSPGGGGAGWKTAALIGAGVFIGAFIIGHSLKSGVASRPAPPSAPAQTSSALAPTLPVAPAPSAPVAPPAPSQPQQTYRPPLAFATVNAQGQVHPVRRVMRDYLRRIGPENALKRYDFAGDGLPAGTKCVYLGPSGGETEVGAAGIAGPTEQAAWSLGQDPLGGRFVRLSSQSSSNAAGWIALSVEVPELKEDSPAVLALVLRSPTDSQVKATMGSGLDAEGSATFDAQQGWTMYTLRKQLWHRPGSHRLLIAVQGGELQIAEIGVFTELLPAKRASR